MERVGTGKPVDLESYSPIVQMIMRDRLAQGNQTLYDAFLCEYSGDPRHKEYSRPLDYRGPSGRLYSYNNPQLHVTSYTDEGTLLDIRHAKGMLEPGDETAEYLIATASLADHVITKWQIRDIEKQPRRDGEIIQIALTQPRYDGAYPMSDTDLTRIRSLPIFGRLAIHRNHGNVFMQPDLVQQHMHDLITLVDTVNDLTSRLRIPLDR